MAAPSAIRRGMTGAVTAVDALIPPRRGVTVLAYHRVGGTTPVGVDLPTSQVADQLDWLVANSQPLDLDEAASRVLDVSDLALDPHRPRVVLTADDGTADWVDTLLPLLVARRLPMTWYVATQFVEEGADFPGGGRPVSWSGLADAVATGLVTIGSHTHTHAVMTRVDRATAAAELDRSIGLIEERLGTPCRHFAYPKAMPPSDDADVEVRRRFRTAALAGNRVNMPGRADPARLGRAPVLRRDDARTFARKVRGGGQFEGWTRAQFDRVRHRSAIT